MNKTTGLYDALLEISTKGNLTKGELSLLIYLISKCGRRNKLKTTLGEIASELNELKGNVWSALRGLQEYGIVAIEKGQRIGRMPMQMKISINHEGFNFNIAEPNVKTTNKPNNSKKDISPSGTETVANSTDQSNNNIHFDKESDMTSKVDVSLKQKIKSRVSDKMDDLEALVNQPEESTSNEGGGSTSSGSANTDGVFIPDADFTSSILQDSEMDGLSDLEKLISSFNTMSFPQKKSKS